MPLPHRPVRHGGEPPDRGEGGGEVGAALETDEEKKLNRDFPAFHICVFLLVGKKSEIHKKNSTEVSSVSLLFSFAFNSAE